jgi:hypothetical protein
MKDSNNITITVQSPPPQPSGPGSPFVQVLVAIIAAGASVLVALIMTHRL